MIGLIAAATILASYDCEVQPPRWLSDDGTTVKLVPLELPKSIQQWKFRISLRQGKTPQAEVSWDLNPINAQGKFPAIGTAPGAYSFATFATGPCLFTETGCTSQFNLTDNGRGPADLLITSAALWSNLEAQTRRPFVAVMQGKCSRSDVRQ